jgi:hypothetical protein
MTQQSLGWFPHVYGGLGSLALSGYPGIGGQVLRG